MPPGYKSACIARLVYADILLSYDEFKSFILPMNIRTRFAPSPTGYLHIGGARTALFSWLYARHHGGSFVLRVEDTDLERSTPESVNIILEGMAWLGLDYDEGPFYQTERFDRYREVIQQLLDSGQAYYCYCTREKLDVMRAEQRARGEKPRYDGRCRTPTGSHPDVPPVVRFRNQAEGCVIVDDLIHGLITFKNSELDDLIIARSDGTPTYNLTVVVDDLDMEISHVIRGDDHINNTPRQINIFKALGATPPKYAHAPMILDEDGRKLSKRKGASSILEYRDLGFLPEVVLNYLVRLGWSYGDQEIFTLDEMIEFFDVKDINKAASALNYQKLLWLNQEYMKNSPLEHIARHLAWHMGRLGFDLSTGPDPVKIVEIQRERSKTLLEMAQNSTFFYQDFEQFDPQAARKNLTPQARGILIELRQIFSDLPDWQTSKLHQIIRHYAEVREMKLGKVAQPVRVACSGGSVSPPIDVTLELLGKERVLKRLYRAIVLIESQPDFLSGN